jgi:energy-coupling factor transporter ATP-binding protein EcfA2
MYIAEIEITDLRSFRGTQKISLDRGDGTYAGWTVFAGRNGSGKSTLLKAIAAAVVGPLAIRSLVGGVPDWVREGSTSARIKANLVVDGSFDLIFEIGTLSLSSLEVGLEWVQSSASRQPVTSFRALQSDDPIDLRPGLGPWYEKPDGWFIAGYGPYRRLGPPTPDVARFGADANLSRLLNLYSESATLADAVDWLKGVHTAALEKRPGAEGLLSDVIKLLNDGLLPDGSTVTKVDSEGMWITRDGVTVPLEQVSDGYRTVTALVVDIARRLHACYRVLALTKKEGKLHCPLPGVVLIDEVDAHLHVEWQQKIGFWLTSHFPNIQFLTTSHSPFICQAASPRGIIRLPAPGEDRAMEHLDERLFHSIVNGGADDAVMSQLFGLEHAHSQPAEQLRERAAELELKLVTGVASPSEQREHAKILSVLPGDLGEEADRKLRMVDKASPSAASKIAATKATATPIKKAPVPAAKKPARAKTKRPAQGAAMSKRGAATRSLGKGKTSKQAKKRR